MSWTQYHTEHFSLSFLGCHFFKFLIILVFLHLMALWKRRLPHIILFCLVSYNNSIRSTYRCFCHFKTSHSFNLIKMNVLLSFRQYKTGCMSQMCIFCMGNHQSCEFPYVVLLNIGLEKCWKSPIAWLSLLHMWVNGS